MNPTAVALERGSRVKQIVSRAEPGAVATISGVAQQQSILVYDGDCAFCTTWVNRLRKTLGVFPEAQPWQWLDLEKLHLTDSEARSAAWFFRGGRVYRGHAAFGAILRMQRSLGLRFLGNLLVTPPFSWVARAGYFFIARYRHRLPGGTPACAMPKQQG